ncbi:MAG: [acyl-carrier-protein] S-malonyltransferase [Acidimicrobiales bacterium]|jgi:[acyl-carrier-protein] S-malonyltransferase
MSSVMIAFTFPGQGSQAPGMGEAWSDHPSWELVAEAAVVSGRDIEHLLLHADQEELTETRNSQLATFMMSMIVLDAVERTGVEPAFHAGHSLGEYSALTASGCISFEDGVRLVTERGNAMQTAADAQDGTMFAILGLDDDKVELACTRTDGDVWVANYNAPGQVVIAGDPEALEAAAAQAKELGAKRAMPIKVGGAFHTPFMSPARDRLRKAIKDTEFRQPNRPVFANVDALPHPAADDWPNLMGAQLTSPVRWRHTLHNMADAGATVFLELGPGTILTGMAKRTIKGTTTISIGTPGDVDQLLEGLSSASETGGVVEGEYLYAVERLVVSPATGVFEPLAGLVEGSPLTAGQLVGHVGSTEVRTAFEGTLQGILALSGERVTTSQPIAWLRTA